MNQQKSCSAWNARSFLLLGGAIYVLFLRPQMLKWGTRLGESQRRLPGDEYIPEPTTRFTHAVNIDAPPEALWPWLAQMGRERTGFYGLDLVTNSGIPSAAFLRKDLPAPTPDMILDDGTRILELEPNRKLLVGGFGLKRSANATLDTTTLYLLERRTDGSTRLLVRTRMRGLDLISAIYVRLFEPVYFMFAHQQLDNLKRLSVSMAHLKR